MRARAPAIGLVALVSVVVPAGAGEPIGIGRPPTSQEIAAVAIDIMPDGKGLPPGQGSVQEGANLFASTCAACHGARGEIGDDAPVPRLAGGQGTLAGSKPLRTVGSYWPYATTLFDYIRRAMPFNAPQTLTDSQVYALVAYVLNLNGVVDDKAVLDARALPAIRMPNRDGFFRTVHQPGN